MATISMTPPNHLIQQKNLDIQKDKLAQQKMMIDSNPNLPDLKKKMMKQDIDIRAKQIDMAKKKLELKLMQRSLQ